MTIVDIIKHILKENRVTQSTLAKRMGYRSQAGVAMILNRQNMNVDTLLRVTEALGYEVVIQPVKQGRRQADQMVIEWKEEGQ